MRTACQSLRTKELWLLRRDGKIQQRFEVRGERNGAETNAACLDENSVFVKVFRGTRAKKTVTGLEEPLGALDDDEWEGRWVGAMQRRMWMQMQMQMGLMQKIAQRICTEK